ncbi:GAF and ANTAR domain-containing protein [Isoptericola croceus]|uniref:GAF and ANTAR domain-containing protein n=1 Tax=Isoptericola croceus TaxID=3031406 RepID=UPI0023F918DD|nr:GAF and ANTAR domain-containing protein [Isoptericola croceus]
MNPTELLGLLVRTAASADAELPLPARLCRACVEILEGQGGTLMVAAGPVDRLVISTSTTFAQIEALQEVLGEGPVQQALHEDRLVVAHVDDAPNRFPVFAQEAARAIGGPLTVYAVPMHAGLQTVGVFSLYITAGRLTRGTEDLQFLADTVGTSLMGDLDALDWSQKAPVHQATGMVTAQLRIPPDDALAVLRAHAFARSTDLQSVAEDVLHRRMTFSNDG